MIRLHQNFMLYFKVTQIQYENEDTKIKKKTTV